MTLEEMITTEMREYSARRGADVNGTEMVAHVIARAMRACVLVEVDAQSGGKRDEHALRLAFYELTGSNRGNEL